MRNLKYIVIHHSAGADLNVEQAALSFSRVHKVKYHDRYLSSGVYQQESLGLHVAYHYLIDRDGNIKNTRELKDVGYHAGNWAVNQEGVGICLIGNFVNKLPTQLQLEAAQKLINKLKEDYNIIPENINGHRTVSFTGTQCPGFQERIVSELAHGVFNPSDYFNTQKEAKTPDKQKLEQLLWENKQMRTLAQRIIDAKSVNAIQILAKKIASI